MKQIILRLSKNATVIQTLLAYVVRGLGAISLFWLYAIIAKRLTPGDAGYVFLGITISTVLSSLSIVGLQMLSLRLIGARSQETDTAEIRFVARRTRQLALPWTIATTLLLFFFAEPIAVYVFQKPPLESVLRWIAPSVFCMGMSLVFSHQLQGLRKFTESLITQALGTQFLCAVVLWFCPLVTVAFAAQVYSVAAAINLLLAIVFWARSLPGNEVSSVEMPQLANSCFSFWVVKAMILAVNWAGLLIAGVLVENPADVALFAVAQRVANLVNFLLIGINVIVTPKFARYWKEGNLNRIEDLALKSTAAISFIGLPVVAALVLYPTTILAVFKPAYTAAAPLLIVLTLSQFFNVLTGSVNQLLSMCELEHDLRNIVIVSGLSSIVMTIIFTSLWGVLGTSVACAASLFLQNLIAVFVVQNKLGFSMFRALHPLYWLSLAKQ